MKKVFKCCWFFFFERLPTLIISVCGCRPVLSLLLHLSQFLHPLLYFLCVSPACPPYLAAWCWCGQQHHNEGWNKVTQKIHTTHTYTHICRVRGNTQSKVTQAVIWGWVAGGAGEERKRKWLERTETEREGMVIDRKWFPHIKLDIIDLLHYSLTISCALWCYLPLLRGRDRKRMSNR